MKQKNNISISLPSHCDQEWDEMTPRGEGRFCTSCQKTVTDFTAMTDAQIIDIFNKAGDDLPCGKFHISQLDRELIAPVKPKFSQLLVKRIAATVILFQSFISLGRAQTAHIKPGTEAGPQSKKGPWPVPTSITGKVVDDKSGAPLADITVVIAGSLIKTVTDSSGAFVLPLTDSLPDTVFLGAYGSDRTHMGDGSHFKMRVNVSRTAIDIRGREHTDHIILYARQTKVFQRMGPPKRMVGPRGQDITGKSKKNK